MAQFMSDVSVVWFNSVDDQFAEDEALLKGQLSNKFSFSVVSNA